MKGAQVYLHYLNDGDIQAGARNGDGGNGVSAHKAWSSKVLACLDVYLAEWAPRTIESVHQVLEEAFARIGTPVQAQFYCEDTSLGRLEYLYRSPFAKDAEEAKAVLENVLRLMGSHPFGESRMQVATVGSI